MKKFPNNRSSASQDPLSPSISPELFQKKESRKRLANASEKPVRSDDSTQPAHEGSSSPFAPLDPNKQDISIGQFKLIKPLGKGGMGSVFLGEHQEIGKQVAIKILKPSLAADQEAVSRFLGEARLITKLEHPSIVDVYDCGFLRGVGRYIIMEYLDGADLQVYLKRQKALSPYEAVSVIWQVLDALEAAHSAEVIHRDIKPSNVFLVRWGKRVLVKLLDFGVAKLLDSLTVDGIRTQTGVILGTPAYMAPEQAAGDKEIDPRVDIYSIGIILFELVTGRRPFIAKNSNEMLIMQQLEQPPPPVAFAPNLPEPLENLILQCLEKDPSRRPSSAKVLRKALQQLLPNMPTKVLAIGLSEEDELPLFIEAPNQTMSYKKGGEGEAKQAPKKRGTQPLIALDQMLSEKSAPKENKSHYETPTTSKSQKKHKDSQKTTAVVPLQETLSLVLKDEASSGEFAKQEEAQVLSDSSKLRLKRSNQKKSLQKHMDMMALRAVATGEKLPTDLFPEKESTRIRKDGPTRKGFQVAVTFSIVLGILSLVLAGSLFATQWGWLPAPPAPPEPKTAIVIDSIPTGAAIFFEDGTLLGKAPLKVPLEEKDFKVRVAKEGFVEILVPVSKENAENIRVPMVPLTSVSQPASEKNP